MITWAEKIAFVGMTMEPTIDDLYPYGVKVRIPGGLCSSGGGHTIEKAIESAAIGMNIDWYSVEQHMTEQEWKRMSHL